MRIKIKTKVHNSVQAIEQQFNEELFTKLNPPFPPATLLRYDGNTKGDRVVIKLNFLLFVNYWESVITANQSSEKKFQFVDEGRVLPFFLKKWKHTHTVEQGDSPDVSYIIDDINYDSGGFFLSLLTYPLLFPLFVYRIPLYKKYLKKS